MGPTVCQLKPLSDFAQCNTLAHNSAAAWQQPSMLQWCQQEQCSSYRNLYSLVCGLVSEDSQTLIVSLRLLVSQVYRAASPKAVYDTLTGSSPRGVDEPLACRRPPRHR